MDLERVGPGRAVLARDAHVVGAGRGQGEILDRRRLVGRGFEGGGEIQIAARRRVQSPRFCEHGNKNARRTPKERLALPQSGTGAFLPISPMDGGRISQALLMRLFGRVGFLLAQVLTFGLATVLLVATIRRGGWENDLLWVILLGSFGYRAALLIAA